MNKYSAVLDSFYTKCLEVPETRQQLVRGENETKQQYLDRIAVCVDKNAENFRKQGENFGA